MMAKQQEAISRIKEKLARIDDLKHGSSESPEFKQWQHECESTIIRIFGEDHRYRLAFSGIGFYGFGSALNDYDVVSQEDFLSGLNEASALLKAILSDLKDDWGEGVSNSDTDSVERIKRICERFHQVAISLRNRHNDRTTLDIEDEYDVQDLLRCLLRIDFDDVRDEEWTPSYAGSCSRMDFLLKSEQIVIEVKKTSKSIKAKEIGEQLIVDVVRYQSHPNCRTLVCFVYDPESRIDNPKGLERDLGNSSERIKVVPIVAPKGL